MHRTTCEVCRDAITIMINRGTGICTEICRGIYVAYPPPEYNGDDHEYVLAYGDWQVKVAKLKEEAIDARR